MKIAIAADHAGFEEKEKIKPFLSELGVEYDDLGTNSCDSVDYPDYAQKVGEAVSKGEAEEGILFCGNPDTVYRQIMEIYDKVGGFGHLSLIGRSGFMTHAESEKGIRLFSNEVLPRLREVKSVIAE